MSSPASQSPAVALGSDLSPDGALTLTLSGRLDGASAASVWEPAAQLVEKENPSRLVVDARGLEYCDGAGIALLLDLRTRQARRNAPSEIRGLRPEFQRLLDQFEPTDYRQPPRPPRPAYSLPDEVGRATHEVWEDFKELVSFVGELGTAFLAVLRAPKRLRWKDALLVAEQAGANALPIVSLIGFLMGLVLAFQSGVLMKQFGVEIYVANLVGLSMVRELGPLMTAIVLAGRSGSAFAAEIGTMKINEEVDALKTMGVDPIHFLVVPRVLAGVFITPLLAVFSSLMGLVGGAIVMLSFGYPLVAYTNQLLADLGGIGLVDFLGGLVKAFAFGILVAAIGCLRGLQTGRGAAAVGRSTTGAVVSGIILIAIADSIFSVIYYYLDI
ncbi:MlaE family lipid ABC transporter permease subunit [Candidatus Sumerlaeota bacterium]|nr:MlaE family lipid ABC transporter permease subunit [Candidatus Sumerlaeota bacterium]